jgi:hypothetical protein
MKHGRRSKSKKRVKSPPKDSVIRGMKKERPQRFSMYLRPHFLDPRNAHKTLYKNSHELQAEIEEKRKRSKERSVTRKKQELVANLSQKINGLLFLQF